MSSCMRKKKFTVANDKMMRIFEKFFKATASKFSNALETNIFDVTRQ